MFWSPNARLFEDHNITIMKVSVIALSALHKRGFFVIKRPFIAFSNALLKNTNPDSQIPSFFSRDISELFGAPTGSKIQTDNLPEGSETQDISSLFKGITELLETALPASVSSSYAGPRKNRINDIYSPYKRRSNNAFAAERNLMRKQMRKRITEMKPHQYVLLMMHWVKKGGAKIGQTMLDQMLKVGVKPEEIYTIMITHYVEKARKCLAPEPGAEIQEEESEQLIVEAIKHLHVFREEGLPATADTYEPLVSWFIEHEKSSELDELVDWVLEDKSFSCLTCLFKYLGQFNKHDEFAKYFISAKAMGTSEDINSSYVAAYVEGMSKECKFDVTVKAFRNVTKQLGVLPNFETYNRLVQCACKEGRVHEALDFIEEMHTRGMHLSSELFHPLLLLFVHGKQTEGAFESFAAMQRMGVQPSPETYNFLIRACMRANNLERIFALLAEMKELRIERTVQTYNAIIQAFGTLKQLDRAIKVLDDMEADDIKPDVGTFAELIYASDASENLEKAIELFGKMKSRGIKPNPLVYSSLVQALVKHGQLERALQIARDVEKSGDKVGAGAKSALLSGLARQHRLPETLQIFQEIKEEGKIPEPYAYGDLIALIGHSGDLNQMFELFENSKGMWPQRLDNVVEERRSDWCASIAESCIRRQELRRMIDFLRGLKEEGHVDVSMICDKIILQITESQNDTIGVPSLNWNDGFRMLDAMHQLNVRPSRMFYEVLLDGCAVLKKRKLASKVIKKMEEEGLKPNILTKIRLLRVYIALQDPNSAASLLNEIKVSLEDEDVYFIVSKILHGSSRTVSKQILQNLEKLGSNLKANMVKTRIKLELP